VDICVSDVVGAAGQNANEIYDLNSTAAGWLLRSYSSQSILHRRQSAISKPAGATIYHLLLYAPHSSSTFKKSLRVLEMYAKIYVCKCIKMALNVNISAYALLEEEREPG